MFLFTDLNYVLPDKLYHSDTVVGNFYYVGKYLYNIKTVQLILVKTLEKLNLKLDCGAFTYIIYIAL